MNTGLLWFDDRKDMALDKKVIEAALYFRRKFGRAPTLCLVHPQDLAGTQLPESGVEAPEQIKVTVRPWSSVLPSHMWIGVDDMPEYALESVAANAKQDREVVR